MSKPFARVILFTALAAALAALPALAGPPPAQPAIAGATATAISPLTPSCQLDVPAAFASPAPAISTPAVPDWLTTGGLSSALSHKFHGFCPCGCSSVPNCNTNADCGGATCRPNISCC
jgi:hypothetical protein